jgi:cytochrome c biogenesis protein CcdA
MKTIDDRQLDQLISDSLQRQHAIESINTQVLAEVKKYNRTRKWRGIVRIVAFSFGVPIMLALMGYCAYRILITADDIMSYALVATVIISAIGMATYSIANFSPNEM